MIVRFYRIVSERQDYKGIRYFKVPEISDTIIQVTENPGEIKKGRNAHFGITLISKITFFQNYLAYGYAKECTKKEYERSFKKVVKMLS